jgi:hypothetical protein
VKNKPTASAAMAKSDIVLQNNRGGVFLWEINGLSTALAAAASVIPLRAGTLSFERTASKRRGFAIAKLVKFSCSILRSFCPPNTPGDGSFQASPFLGHYRPLPQAAAASLHKLDGCHGGLLLSSFPLHYWWSKE